MEEFYETTADDLSEEITETFEKYQERGFFEIDMKYIKRGELLNDIQADLQLLKKIFVKNGLSLRRRQLKENQ